MDEDEDEFNEGMTINQIKEIKDHIKKADRLHGSPFSFGILFGLGETTLS